MDKQPARGRSRTKTTPAQRSDARSDQRSDTRPDSDATLPERPADTHVDTHVDAHVDTRTERPVDARAEKTAERPATRERPRPFDHIAAAMQKYTEMGWQAVRAPRGNINDIVATKQLKQAKFHFVRVVTEKNIADDRYHGTSKNAFIQNAFSNSAIPVFAHVTKVKLVNGEHQCQVTFENVNEQSRVIIGSAKKAEKTEARE